MDRHTMQSEVGYLFSRLQREKGRMGKSREKHTDTHTDTQNTYTHTQWMGGSGHGLSLKETEQTITLTTLKMIIFLKIYFDKCGKFSKMFIRFILCFCLKAN